MDPDDVVASPTDGDSETLRADVFSVLLTEQRGLSPSELGDELDVSRQSVQYHLSTLTEQGLVVADDGEYFVQPLFIDPDFSDAFEDALADLVPLAERKLYIDESGDNPPEEILMNCLRVAVTMHLLPDDETV